MLDFFVWFFLIFFFSDLIGIVGPRSHLYHRCHSTIKPSGPGSVGDRSLMDVLFRTLYEIEAVLEAAVHGFAALLKKDKRKAKALSQIQTFVTYLETAEEEA